MLMSDSVTVTVYSSSWCPYCIRAKQLLERKGARYVEVNVDGQPEKRREMMQRGGGHTVPQIWIGDTHVGGCDELYALERAGRLDAMLFEDSSQA